ncbi:T9SS type A sorting domain-containing protein [Chryseobacterium suipulveris]|uniref:T9SS type A sorting domain-containing protein n=1 Tax=Chryseobacterium suipulveris TaxID=2929800 RepID=A0ABY4BND1_9FLAO|nr:GEVED domain-containing protein [Chryseobacterium suipulveris]UOE40404.1 T9SS type A sorting domain-containing protein [Chryseobacterium suipulveris]
MKKLLLSCFLALGIGANAQFNFTGDFEDQGANGAYGQFGGGTIVAAAACNGAWGGQTAISASVTQSGWMVMSDAINQTSNGQKLTLTANWKKGATLTGTASLAYFVFDAGSNSWSIFEIGTPVTMTAAATTSCASLTATIPAGVLSPSKTYGFGVWVRRSGTSTGNFFVDDINFVQDIPTGVPGCATVTAPTAGSTISGGNVRVSWNAVDQAGAYKVSIGSSSGASDVYSGTISGANYVDVQLATNSTFYLKVVPTNTLGDATGCTEIMFNTNANVAHCGPLTSTAPSAIAPIKSVNFAGMTNTSDPTATTIGTFPVHQDFTTGVAIPEVNPGSTYPLTVLGTTNGNPANGWAMSVFIDWNNDGDFLDAGEEYFNTTATMVRKAGVADNPIELIGNVAVPGTAAPGNVTMRVKYNFSGTSINSPLTSGCANMINGQVEDYIIKVAAPTAPPACATITAPTNGATNVPANNPITWNAVTGAQGYKVYIGTTSGGTDVANGTVVSTTSYTGAFTSGVTYYVKVVPYNAAGDATGCTEISFTAGAVVYCGPLSYPFVEPISNVTFANINNTTSAATGGAAHEDFTAIQGLVEQSGTYPISLNGNSDGPYSNYYVVFIDWNQNGKLDDAGEVYFGDGSIFLNNSTGTGTPVVGNITVPADAKLGVTRMRVKKEYSAAVPTAGNGFADPCATSGSFGQAEDYSLKVVGPGMAVSNVDKDKVSVYPNPFHDVLKISDVKGVKSISITDVSGRTVKTMKPSAELNLSSLNAGLYIVSLHMEDGSVKTVKAIKK